MHSSSRLTAKAALFNEHGKLLVLRRSSTDTVRPGEFDLPGGKFDLGEHPDQTIVREIKEEINLEILISNLAMQYTTTTFYDNTSMIRFLYVAYVKNDQPITLSFEHDAYDWLTLEETFQKYSHPTWVGGLKYLLEHQLLHESVA